MVISRFTAAATADVLKALVRTPLPAASWTTAMESVAVLEAAVDAGDERRLIGALGVLDGLLPVTFRGPVRVGQADAPSSGDRDEPDDSQLPPKDVRERVNELIHRLLPDQPGPGGSG
jgi:hypothetical protein